MKQQLFAIVVVLGLAACNEGGNKRKQEECARARERFTTELAAGRWANADAAIDEIYVKQCGESPTAIEEMRAKIYRGRVEDRAKRENWKPGWRKDFGWQ